jgi:hypothetical protein
MLKKKEWNEVERLRKMGGNKGKRDKKNKVH